MLPDINLDRLNGTSENTHLYAGKVLLVVNVASKCGFTPQYKQLQALYKEFQNQGFEILGFPCDQFGGQEPGDPEEIQQFCEMNFGVTFPIFKKTDVNGPDTHPLFKWIKAAAPGILGTESIKWNFTKFLINREGEVVKRYASATSPQNIKSDIEKLL